MVIPIDYSINVADPFQSVLQGFKVGDFLQQRQVQQQQQQLAQQQAQQQAAAQQQMQADLGAVAGNPNASGADYAGLMTKYPQLSENLKRSWDVLDTSQRQAKLEQMSQVHAALKSGKPQVAKDYLQTLLTAAQDGGDERTKAGLQALIQQIDIDPEATKVSTGISLIAQVGPEKYAEAYGKFGAEERAQEQAPFALAEQKSKAEQAKYDTRIKEVKAKYADSEALLDLERKRWDITKITEDIAIQKEQNRIAALNSAISRETNQLKKQELQQKVDEAKEKRDEKIREKVATAETELASVTDAKVLLGEILSDEDTLFAVTGTSAFRGAIPGTKSRAMAGKIEQLQNMLAATNLDKLKGPMSDKDILFVKRIAANLDRYQDEDLFKDELGKVNEILTRTEGKVRAKHGIPKADSAVPPKPGTIDEGYRFKGGDPSKPENWEKL